MTYRTSEQFDEIATSVINGNWTQAAEETVEYGFYANDLLNHHTENPLVEVSDLVLLIEKATELRGMKGD